MQTAYDVELRNRFAVAGGSGLEGFFKRHGVSAGRVFLSPESAEAAGGHANIRGIDVAVDVEVGLVAMHALAHGIRQPADGQDVGGAIERESVVGIQTLMGEDFVLDSTKSTVVALKGVALRWLR